MSADLLRLIASSLRETGGDPAAMARNLGQRWDAARDLPRLQEIGGVRRCGLCARWYYRGRVSRFGLCSDCEKGNWR